MKSWHFIPAAKREYYEKINHLDASVFILDLEDGTAFDERDNGLKLIERNSSLIEKKNCFLRINNLEDNFDNHELEILNKINFKGVILPKTNSPITIERFKRQFQNINNNPWVHEIIVLIESLKGVENIDEIVKSKEVGLTGIGLGLEDLMSDLTQLSLDKSVITHIKLKVAIKCHCSNLRCIDTVSLNFKERDQFILECKKSSSLLFNGKFSIHPFQIGLINENYSPTKEEVNWAQDIANTIGLKADVGYQSLDNVVTSPPKIKKAKLILKKAGLL